MPDAALHGNGEPCPACALRRGAEDTSTVLRAGVPCNNCGGTGRVALPVGTIIAHHVAWARAHHWPDFDRRTAGP